MRGAVKFLVNSGVWDEINGSDSKASYNNFKDYRAKACAIAENGLELSIYIRGGLSLLNELPDSFSELEDWKMIRLHIANEKNLYPLAKTLISHAPQTDLNATDTADDTPMKLASRNGHTRLMNLLPQSGGGLDRPIPANFSN